MGLRIIRPLHRVTDVSDADRLRELEHETENWFASKGELGARARREFIDKFQDVRARIHADEEIVAMAQEVRRRILGHGAAPIGPHAQVDVATLLVLL